MTKKLSSYAAKVRQGLVPHRYGERRAIADPWVRYGADGQPRLSDAAHAAVNASGRRAMERFAWRTPLVRVVRHWGIIGGERRMIPLTAEQLRATRY